MVRTPITQSTLRVFMPRDYEPDLTVDPNSPFVRDAANKLVRRGYWMDMNDRTLVMVARDRCKFDQR
jgi:hypothetical protein